jgi:hypothetical protein
MDGQDLRTAGGMAIRATRGMIGATARSMIHIGVGAGALAGVVIRTILDIFHRTIITTTIHLTMVVAIAVLLWHIVRIAQHQVEDLRILAAVIDLQHLSRV